MWKLIGSYLRLMRGVVGLRNCRTSQGYRAKWKKHGRMRICLWILMDGLSAKVLT